MIARSTSSLVLKVSRIAFAVCALTIVAAAFVKPVLAFELFGISLFGREDDSDEGIEGERIGVPVPYDVSVSVLGEDAAEGLDGEAVRLASSLWRERDEPASGDAGLLAGARADYRSLLGALYAQGFYGASISIGVNGREASDVSPGADLSSPVEVAIEVTPGPLYRFGRLEIVGDASVTAQRLTEDASIFEDFASGQPARSTVILAAERAAVSAWRAQGFALASAGDRNVVADHSTRTLDVTLLIVPDRQAHYGPLAVEGIDRMDPQFVAYMADLPTGEIYDPREVAEATERLAALEVFRSVRIENAGALSADGSLPQSILVQERPLRRVGAGATFSSVDGAGLEAFWLHRNLFGRAERLRVEGTVSGIDSVDPDDFTYRFGAALTRPGFLTPDTKLIAALNAAREVLESYTRVGVDGAVGVDHPFSRELTGRFAVQGRYAEFDDDVFAERDFASAGFEARLTYDTRDLPTAATSGLFLEAAATPYYEFINDNLGIALTGEARAYQSLTENDRLILAARAKIGTALGPSIAETAPDRLFLAGGGSSVRGYAFRNIGVLQPNGEITGGRFLLEGSVEARARFTDTIGGVIFADAGYVDADSVPNFEDDLRVGVGTGLRYLTPLGPIRFDVAVPLDPGDGDDDVAFYIGIGEAF
ncbi:MAG: autotransporter assembly complex family protein [Pseudomonadota bacterium]